MRLAGRIEPGSGSGAFLTGHSGSGSAGFAGAAALVDLWCFRFFFVLLPVLVALLGSDDDPLLRWAREELSCAPADAAARTRASDAMVAERSNRTGIVGDLLASWT